jgi:peptidoglycan/LPS O-acetylase OafA/YrhL
MRTIFRPLFNQTRLRPPRTHDPQQQQHPNRKDRRNVVRFYLLDALRGAASLSVVIWHYQGFFPSEIFTPEIQPLYTVLKPFYLYGFHAVELFFVLSGFVFFSQYLQKIQLRHVTPLRFFVLRFSRLYPLHFVTLLFVAALLLVSQKIEGPSIGYPCNDAYHFVLNLLLISHWGLQKCFSFNGPTWSVSVEVLLYVLFFVFAVVVPRTAWLRMMSVVLAAIIGISVMRTFPSGVPWDIGTAILCFYAGGAVFLLLDFFIDVGWKSVHLCMLAMLGLLGVAAAIMYTGGRGKELLLYGVAFPAIVMALAAAQYAHRELGKTMRVLGDISYSSYLTHVPIQFTLLLAGKAHLLTINYRTTGCDDNVFFARHHGLDADLLFVRKESTRLFAIQDVVEAQSDTGNGSKHNWFPGTAERRQITQGDIGRSTLLTRINSGQLEK